MGQAVVEALAARLGAQIIETHLSWVLLAAGDAYKMKKPLRLAFVDYGSLAARRFCCEEEMRLNQRLAHGLYLGVLRVTGSVAQPRFAVRGRAIEYAVHMRRFPPGSLFCEMLADGRLEPTHIDALSQRLADFHVTAPRAPATAPFGAPKQRLDCALAALDGTRAHATGQEYTCIGRWLLGEAARLAPTWRHRHAGGFVRECHGDLHLANIVLVDGQAMAFDCIEFDPALRWIDILDDIAFTVMDLDAHGRRDLAWRLLNGWLDRTGDHAAVPALRFSAAYRALVRAQVRTLRGDEQGARKYLDAAIRWTQPARAALTITHGLPGSGKTFQSQRLLEADGAIRLRSDVERKRLFGLGMLENSKSHGVDVYAPGVGRRTYSRLLVLARVLLRANYPVILDAAFLRKAERRQARALARRLDVPFSILNCGPPLRVLRERLRARTGDASEADEHVLDVLRLRAQPLSAAERNRVRAPSSPA